MPPLSETAAAAVADRIAFDGRGLAPAIAQQHDSGEVLMLAWMDRAAVIETLTTGRVTYYSRSRGARWRKGDTSGHTQTLKAFRIDCDHDTILVLIEQVGRACHTGRRSCFYHEVRDDGWVDVSANSFDI